MPERKPSGLKTFSNHPPATPKQSDISPGPSVREMFDGLASNYDRFNAWASLGLHRRWRRLLVARTPRGGRVLDLATGTGDVAFLLAGRGQVVVGVDFSEGMLMQARRKDHANRIQWVLSSADQLPFPERSFEAITSAFALRNLRHCLDGAFRENYRVLTPGGRVLHMDFGRPTSRILQWGHQWYLRHSMAWLGRKICGAFWPDDYLQTTIEGFDEPADVEARLRQAGFSNLRHSALLWGVVQLYEGTKL